MFWMKNSAVHNETMVIIFRTVITYQLLQ